MREKQNSVREYESGDIVEPGDYIDVETGAIVHVHERDELPAGHVDVEVRRRFRKIDSFTASRLHENPV